MYPPPAWLLNRVARTTTLATRAGTILFNMNEEQLEAALAAQVEMLTATGIDPIVISAYRTLGLMLLEREAIGTFLSRPENSGWNGALIEICSAEEAVTIAELDLHLDEPQAEALYRLLDKLM